MYTLLSADISLQPPMDGLSSVSWSGDSSKLLVSSWDGVRLIEALGNCADAIVFYSLYRCMILRHFSPVRVRRPCKYSVYSFVSIASDLAFTAQVTLHR